MATKMTTNDVLKRAEAWLARAEKVKDFVTRAVTAEALGRDLADRVRELEEQQAGHEEQFRNLNELWSGPAIRAVARAEAAEARVRELEEEQRNLLGAAAVERRERDEALARVRELEELELHPCTRPGCESARAEVERLRAGRAAPPLEGPRELDYSGEPLPVGEPRDNRAAPEPAPPANRCDSCGQTFAMRADYHLHPCPAREPAPPGPCHHASSVTRPCSECEGAAPRCTCECIGCRDADYDHDGYYRHCNNGKTCPAREPALLKPEKIAADHPIFREPAAPPVCGFVGKVKGWTNEGYGALRACMFVQGHTGTHGCPEGPIPWIKP